MLAEDGMGWRDAHPFLQILKTRLMEQKGRKEDSGGAEG
jgi:hypothetical protein